MVLPHPLEFYMGVAAETASISPASSPRTLYADSGRKTYVRNMEQITRGFPSMTDDPEHIRSDPLPVKVSVPCQRSSETRMNPYSDTSNATGDEREGAWYLSDDLVDHMFGHLVSINLAKDILHQFIVDGVVQVFKGKHFSATRTRIVANSEDARSALEQALYEAKKHGLRSVDPDEQPTQSGRTTKKAVYSWQWNGFPGGRRIDEYQLVNFLNTTLDHAFDFARLQLIAPNNELRHRFAAPSDKHHAIPLEDEPDAEDMRPDVFLLPTEAFADSNELKEKYMNFTAIRAVGGSKTNALPQGIKQVYRYLRSIRRAQPWLHFSVAIAIAKDRLCLLRGDSSGTERVELSLTEGRGCIEFIRILLGLALANPFDLGQDPHIELESAVHSYPLPDPTRFLLPSSSTLLSLTSWKTAPARLESARRTYGANDVQPLDAFLLPSHTHSVTDSPPTKPDVSLTSRKSFKRHHSGIENEYQDKPVKKQKMTHFEQITFSPRRVYGYECLGVLYEASFDSGPWTGVFTVLKPNDPNNRLALKMVWQTGTHSGEQGKVSKRLSECEPPRNVIMPFETFKPSRESTLGVIRGFLGHQFAELTIENRLLSVSLAELKRPVKYFWGVHDFVRGLRGALRGHEYLTSIGILHGDISENNIVLALRPGEERGYLIDLGMAILREAEKPTPPEFTPKMTASSESSSELDAACPFAQHEKQPFERLCTGTLPYMSFNVLHGGKPTHFDEVESFLYVLLLFFFSYTGPLSEKGLCAADSQGFIEPIGSGPLPHMRPWPPLYRKWLERQSLGVIYAHKAAGLKCCQAGLTLVSSEEVQDCLQSWHPDLRSPIKSLLRDAWDLFSEMTVLRSEYHIDRTEVSHSRFIGLLDIWLEKYADLEDRLSNCPFS